MAEIVFRSKKTEEVLQLAYQVAASDANVLIQGETGTGKGLLAEAIHQNSRRSRGPFVPVDCGSLSPTLIESELFGHIKGSFTGASANRRGLFQEAQSGTVFLDEISELPLDLQVKLLRACQYREIRRLGSNQSIQLDIRILAATNQEMSVLLRTGKFRQDLYFRLSVVSICIPPLRERREDIAPLVCHYLKEFGRRSGHSSLSISTEAMDALLDHSWPGNVRELENVVERAIVLSKNNRIEISDLPDDLRFCPASLQDSPSLTLRTQEERHILEILRQNNGNQTRTAEILGISYSTLWRKLKKINAALPDGDRALFRNCPADDSERASVFVA